MKVIKRNGSEVDFDIDKIMNAIRKANAATLHAEMTEEQIREAAEYISFKCERINRAVSVEEIQDMVENHLMGTMAFEVAKHYILYRYEHEKARRRNNELETELFRHPDYLTEINPTDN